VIPREMDYAYTCDVFYMYSCSTCQESTQLQTERLLFLEFEYLIIKYVSFS
jgi:hypothetical protein